MSSRDQIIQRVDKARDLPTLPTVFTKIRNVLNRPTSSASDVAAILKDDIALSSKTLRVANSAAFAASEEITSVSFAIARMGFKVTADLAMSLSVLNLFGSGTGRIDYTAFWKHSLCVAAAMPLVAVKSGRVADNPQTTFTAGLLHDVGVFILDQHGGDLYGSVLSMIADKKQPLYEGERQLMQTDHGDIGAHVLKKWNLPDKIVDAVRMHHTPPEPSEKKITVPELIYVANEICKSMGIHNGFDSCVPEVEEEGRWTAYGLGDDNVSAIKTTMLREVEKSEVLLAIGKEA